MDSNENNDDMKIIPIPEDDGEMKPVDKDVSISVQDIKEVSNEIQIKMKRSKSLDPTHKLEGFDPIRRRISSIMSMGDLIGDAIVTESYGQVKNGKWYLTKRIDSTY